MSNSISGVVSVVIVIVLVVIGYNLFHKDTWSGIATSNETGLAHKYQDFSSKEECLGWVSSGRFSNDASERECGKNCEPPKTTLGAYVCDETYDQ